MKQETTIYETGAISHAVNDLILFTDNTLKLAEKRDTIYKDCVIGKISPYNMFWQFRYDLFSMALLIYKKEMPYSHDHLLNISRDQEYEFAELYTNDFAAWKK